MILIPDSSFFICFFDDLKPLLTKEVRLLFVDQVFDNFDVKVSPIVFNEVGFENEDRRIKKHIVPEIFRYTTDNNVLESLRPVWSKGEFEVICLAYNYKIAGDSNFIFIIDDLNAREIILTYLNELKNFLKGTVGFIGYCTNQKIFDQEGAISILMAIKKSKSRVDVQIVNKIIKEIQGIKN